MSETNKTSPSPSPQINPQVSVQMNTTGQDLQTQLVNYNPAGQGSLMTRQTISLDTDNMAQAMVTKAEKALRTQKGELETRKAAIQSELDNIKYNAGVLRENFIKSFTTPSDPRCEAVRLAFAPFCPAAEPPRWKAHPHIPEDFFAQGRLRPGTTVDVRWDIACGYENATFSWSQSVPYPSDLADLRLQWENRSAEIKRLTEEINSIRATLTQKNEMLSRAKGMLALQAAKLTPEGAAFAQMVESVDSSEIINALRD